MDVNQGYTEVNGTRLYYEVAGSGQPLVLIHGFTLDTRMWDDQFKIFAQNYRVIRYDVRGHGKSDNPTEESYSHSDDLLALLELFGESQAHILGLSLGGMIAIDFVLTYPEAVKTLIPVDTSGLGGFPFPPDKMESLGIISTTAKEKSVDEAREIWMSTEWFEPAMEQPEVAAACRRIVGNYSGWNWLNNNPLVRPEPPAAGRLTEIMTPTLVITGQRDTRYNHDVADLLVKSIPNVQHAVIPNVGHMSNMEAPEAFNKAVLDYLKDIEA